MGLVSGRRRGGPQRQERFWGITQPSDLVPRRTGIARPLPYIDNDRAMRYSAVWAALRQRADLISTMPVDVFRYVDLGDGPVQVTAAKTPLLVNPGGAKVPFDEWMYSSQVELDRSGNHVGIIRETDGAGYPLRVDSQPSSVVEVIVKAGEIYRYRVRGVEYTPDVIWHERQYTVPGLAVGLSPVAYAAYTTLGEYATVQEFATAWFLSGKTPRARLKNTDKTLSPKEATIVKEAWRASQATGEPFVHGSDWEYSLIAAEKASADWLEAKRFGVVDIARFFGVPADLIDGAVSGQSITYANITQRNLQFLIMNLGPAITRRERALTNAIPRPRFVKLNSDALLRMDPMSRAQLFKMQIDARILAPSEARALDNRAPFTPAQMAEFDELGLNKTAAAPAPKPAGPAPDAQQAPGGAAPSSD